MALWTLGTSPVENLPIAHPQLIGYAINGTNWIFAAYTFQPSYRLILQREGFSGDLLGKSDELDELTDYLERPHVETVYQLVDQPPAYWFDNSVRSELEHLILSGKIQVFKVSDAHAIRLADRHDPIYSNPNNLDSTGNTLVDIRNELAEALGKEIMERWVGKDKADRIHFDRWWGWRETVELYDVGEATFDVVAGLITGLIDLTKFVITVVGDTIELAYNITMAQKEFATKLARGDFDAAKEDLRQLGVAVEDVFKDIETLKAQVEEGASLFKALISDPYARDLIADYLDSLYQSIEYRESRVIGVKIVAAVGLEVLLVLATAGAGNAARWAGQAASKGAQAARAGRIGPFSAKAIDLMADLARLIKQRGMKSKPDEPEIKVVPETQPSYKPREGVKPLAGDRVYKRDHLDGDPKDPYTLQPDGKPLGAKNGEMPIAAEGLKEFDPEYQRLINEEGYPNVTGRKDYENFSDIRPVELKEGEKIYRIVDEGSAEASGKSGSYWARELPSDKSTWRDGYAVKDSWNDNGYFVEHTVGPEGMKVWEGTTAGQQYRTFNNERFYLEGGQQQLYVEFNSISGLKPSPTNWTNAAL